MAVMFLGCATVFTGTKDTLRFDTEPRGAELSINGERICRLEGYWQEQFRLHTDFNYVSLANLNFIFGWAMDIATGAILRYDRREYRFELRPEEPRRQTGGQQRDTTNITLLPKLMTGQAAKD
ncbi:MAG: hypothetical protein EBZ67_01970 [Chitinophagia bacterium]|nr:hypothetical protein [Chitinophagia bacterium]